MFAQRLAGHSMARIAWALNEARIRVLWTLHQGSWLAW
jgi:hypothetical protein